MARNMRREGHGPPEMVHESHLGPCGKKWQILCGSNSHVSSHETEAADNAESDPWNGGKMSAKE